VGGPPAASRAKTALGRLDSMFRLQQRLVILLRLLGIGFRELQDRLPEPLPIADVARNDASIAGAGVTATQQFATDNRVLDDAFALQFVQIE